MKTMHVNHNQRGSVLLYAMLTMSVMLAIGLTLNALFLNKFKLAAQQRDSMVALYAADSAAELCLYESRTNTNDPPMVMDNGALFSMTGDPAILTFATTGDLTDDCSVLGSASFQFRASGMYRGVQRTLEINQ